MDRHRDVALHHHEVEQHPAVLIAVGNVEPSDDRGDTESFGGVLHQHLTGDLGDAVGGHTRHRAVTVSEQIGLGARIVVVRCVHRSRRTVEERESITTRGRDLHEIGTAVGVAGEGLGEVVALRHREVEDQIEIGRNLVESPLLEVDAHRAHTLGFPRLSLNGITETRRSEHRVTSGRERFGERSGHPAGHASDENALTGDRFHGSPYQS